MGLTDPFRTACVLVWACLWRDLEQGLTALGPPHLAANELDKAVELRREIALLELALLKDRCTELCQRQRLSGAEVAHVAGVIARVSEALAFEHTASLPQVALRIARAQNLLFDEVRALVNPGSEAQRRAG
jgi:hypothetical protein